MFLDHCEAPVEVIGFVDVEVCVGTRAPVMQCLQVLNSDKRVFVLGRELMGKFGAVAFDFQENRIKLGNTWEPVQDLVSGSTPPLQSPNLKRPDTAGSGDDTSRGIDQRAARNWRD